MNVIRSCMPYVLRTVRYVVHFLIDFVCYLTYGKLEELPPITNKILLEPAISLAQKIRRKEIKSVDLVEAMTARIKDVQPFINAMVDDNFIEALKQAKEVDEFVASGEKTEEEMEKATPLLGVPFSCKEYIALKGLYWTNGLYSRKGARAEFDADVVKRLKKAGAIPLVKTNVPELSMWFDCSNYVYGTTKNPYDTRRIPGGSSGGEAALISSGGSIIGLGSDLGGSMRVPAFENGIFAHKPTAGMIPDVGTYPPFPTNISLFYSCLGPMCRYASDLRPMMRILAGEKLDLDKPVDFSQLKIFYTDDGSDHPLTSPVSPEIKGALSEALRYFEEKHGATVTRINLNELNEAFLMWFHVLADAGFPSLENGLSDGNGRLNLTLEFARTVLGRCKHTLPALSMALFLRGLPDKNSDERREMLRKFNGLRDHLDDLLDENCVLFHPTQPRPAPYLYTTLPKCFDVGYTAIFNILGYPSTQCPLRLSRGLPIGIQVAGNALQDNLTIAVAEELERGFNGWTSPNPILVN